MSAYRVYTDGGAEPNPGAGGWGAVIVDPEGREQEISGSAPRTTNNRMELTAAIEALAVLPESEPVVVFTDSTYLRNGITRWVSAWMRRGWRKADGNPVLNADLWRRLVTLTERRRVDWKWLRGHAGHTYNERADTLASAAIQRDRPAGPKATSSPPVEADADVVLKVAHSRGKSGWAARLGLDGGQEVLCDGRAGATANQMEIVAATRALEALPSGVGTVAVYSASDYLRHGASKWMKGWKQRGWTTKQGRPVKNRDDWLRLDAAMRGRKRVLWPSPGPEERRIMGELEARAREQAV